MRGTLCCRRASIIGTAAAAAIALSSPAARSAPIDVSGMRAIYDSATGGLRFEGLTDIHGVGVSKAPTAMLNYAAANHASPLTVAYDDEVGWLFQDGIAGGAFDAGTILPPGLGDRLGDYYVGVVRMGSGLDVTPIPIESAGTLYSPTFNPVGGTGSPATTAPPQPNFNAMHAIYDGATGSLRIDGIDGVHEIGVSRAGAAPFTAYHANGSIPTSTRDRNRVVWMTEGIGMSFLDAGRLLPPGLSSELSQYLVQADSWTLPITAAGVDYASEYGSASEIEASWLPEPVAEPEAPAPPLPEFFIDTTPYPSNVSPTREDAVSYAIELLRAHSVGAGPLDSSIRRNPETEVVSMSGQLFLGYGAEDSFKILPYYVSSDLAASIRQIGESTFQANDERGLVAMQRGGLQWALSTGLTGLVAAETSIDEASFNTKNLETQVVLSNVGAKGIGSILMGEVVLTAQFAGPSDSDVVAASPIPEPHGATLAAAALILAAGGSRRFV